MKGIDYQAIKEQSVKKGIIHWVYLAFDELNLTNAQCIALNELINNYVLTTFPCVDNSVVQSKEGPCQYVGFENAQAAKLLKALLTLKTFEFKIVNGEDIIKERELWANTLTPRFLRAWIKPESFPSKDDILLYAFDRDCEDPLSFVGREPLLQHFAQSLEGNSSFSAQVIAGPIGVGKTALAAHYVYSLARVQEKKSSDKRDYVYIFWLNAKHSKFQTSLRLLAYHLGFDFGKRYPIKELSELVFKTLSQLSQPVAGVCPRVLIVLNNADEYRHIEALLPSGKIKESCNWIITTRGYEAEWSAYFNEKAEIHVLEAVTEQLANHSIFTRDQFATWLIPLLKVAHASPFAIELLFLCAYWPDPQINPFFLARCSNPDMMTVDQNLGLLKDKGLITYDTQGNIQLPTILKTFLCSWLKGKFSEYSISQVYNDSRFLFEKIRLKFDQTNLNRVCDKYRLLSNIHFGILSFTKDKRWENSQAFLHAISNLLIVWSENQNGSISKKEWIFFSQIWGLFLLHEESQYRMTLSLYIAIKEKRVEKTSWVVQQSIAYLSELCQATKNKITCDNLNLHFQDWLNKLSPEQKEFWQQLEISNLKTTEEISKIARCEFEPDPCSFQFFSHLDKKNSLKVTISDNSSYLSSPTIGC